MRALWFCVIVFPSPTFVAHETSISMIDAAAPMGIVRLKLENKKTFVGLDGEWSFGRSERR